MIFVTVGTHEQQFDRLIRAIDDLKSKKIIKDKVFVQTGFSNYKPKYCEYNDFLSYDEINNKLKQARIIITHGGPSSFIPALQLNKIPIVVPRKSEFSEHVNNHQFEFVKKLEHEDAGIIPIYEINDLEKVIKNYNNIIKNMQFLKFNHNKEFCQEFEKIVNDLNIKNYCNSSNNHV